MMTNLGGRPSKDGRVSLGDLTKCPATRNPARGQEITSHSSSTHARLVPSGTLAGRRNGRKKRTHDCCWTLPMQGRGLPDCVRGSVRHLVVVYDMNKAMIATGDTQPRAHRSGIDTTPCTTSVASPASSRLRASRCPHDAVLPVRSRTMCVSTPLPRTPTPLSPEAIFRSPKSSSTTRYVVRSRGALSRSIDRSSERHGSSFPFSSLSRCLPSVRPHRHRHPPTRSLTRLRPLCRSSTVTFWEIWPIRRPRSRRKS